MTVFSCAHEWDAMLTCIYEAWTSRIGQQNIRMELEPVSQFELFTEYIHVEADEEKFDKVSDAIVRKISPHVYYELAYTSMAYEDDILDNIYRVLLLGFSFGPRVLEMVQYKDIMRNRQIKVRLANESCLFKEFVRFHDIGGLLIAHVEPKSKIALKLGHDFEDRMPSENWVIVDDVHMEAAVHPKNEHVYIRKLNNDDITKLLKTEENNDEFTDLWKLFFNTIAIQQRANARLQMSHMPLWTRKHVVEFE